MAKANRKSSSADSLKSWKSTRTQKVKSKKSLLTKEEKNWTSKVKHTIEKKVVRPTRNVVQKRIEPVRQKPVVIEIEKSKLTNHQKPTLTKPFKEDLRSAAKEIKGCIKEVSRRIEKVWYSTTRKEIVARVADKGGQ